MMIPPDLEAAIQRYETAIAAIENTIQTAVRIQAKVIRDRRLNHAVKSATRDALSAANASKLQLQQAAIEATKQVMTEQSIEAIAREINLALNADATQIQNLVETQTNLVETRNLASLHWDEEINIIIDTAAQDLTNEQILEVLTARDAVQLVLSQETPIFTGQLLEKLKRGDRYLTSRKWLELISQIELGEWRDIFHPPETAWWWYLELPPPPVEPEPVSVWNRFDWLWNSLTWLFLMISISLVGNLATKVFSGEADNFLGIFSVVSPTVVTFFSGKQALTKKGQEYIKIKLDKWNIDRKYFQEARCLIAAAICGGILIFYYLLVPNIANYLGENYEKSGKLELAKEQYELAVNFKYISAYPNLARVLLERGESEYQNAENIIKEGMENIPNTEAGKILKNELINQLLNLVNLYNKNQAYSKAIEMIFIGFQKSHKDNISHQYLLRKNLGYAELQLKNYNQAENDLVDAINWAGEPETSSLQDKGVMAQCFLAEVLDRKNEQQKAMKHWAICSAYTERYNPDQNMWHNKAQQRMENKGEY